MKFQVDSEYLDLIFDPAKFKVLMEKTATCIKNLKQFRRKAIKPQAIAVTGVSGLSAGGAVSLLTGLPLCIIRKGRSHSSYQIEGPQVDRYLILDDRIATGATMCKIMVKMNTFGSSSCVGIVLWHPEGWFSSVLHSKPIEKLRQLPIYIPNSSIGSQAYICGRSLRSRVNTKGKL